MTKMSFIYRPSCVSIPVAGWFIAEHFSFLLLFIEDVRTHTMFIFNWLLFAATMKNNTRIQDIVQENNNCVCHKMQI